VVPNCGCLLRRIVGICFLISAFFISVLIPFSSAALEPMSAADMDAVQAQSGIAVSLDNIGIYNSITSFSYEDTTGTDSKIVFANTESLLRLDTDHPLTIRTLQNVDGMPLVAFELLSPDGDEPALIAYLEMNTETLEFVGADLGSLHLNFRPPSVDLMGFMEEFALYAAPFGALDALHSYNFDPALFDGDGGIGFQFETRSGIDEILWNYNRDEDNEFYLRGIQMFGGFDGEGAPEGRFLVGNLAPYDNDSDIGPAAFQVLSDVDGGFVRFTLPMEGSARIDEIGMYTLDSGTGDYVAPAGDGFGPMIIDDMQVHHFQLDFRP